MEAPAPSPEPPLPDDVATLQRMVRELLAEVAQLRAQLDQALQRRGGRHSERRRRRRPAGDDERPAPGRDEHGRAPLPEGLERRQVVHELSEAERLCPCCGRPRACIGAQTAEQLELEPARLYVLRTIKKSYACQHCDPAAVPPEQRIQTAGPEQVGSRRRRCWWPSRRGWTNRRGRCCPSRR